MCIQSTPCLPARLAAKFNKSFFTYMVTVNIRFENSQHISIMELDMNSIPDFDESDLFEILGELMDEPTGKISCIFYCSR